MMEIRRELFLDEVSPDPDRHLDPRSCESVDTGSVYLTIGIIDADHDSSHLSVDQRADTGPGSAGVTTRLQGREDGGTGRGRTSGIERNPLGVATTWGFGCPVEHRAVVRNHHRTNPRIRRGGVPDPSGVGDRTLHEDPVVGHPGP